MYGLIMLEWPVSKYGVIIVTWFSWLRMASNLTTYERGIQSSVSVKFWKFLDLLVACQLLKEDTAPYNYYFERVLFLDGINKQRT
jgi:hypothetical protein